MSAKDVLRTLTPRARVHYSASLVAETWPEAAQRVRPDRLDLPRRCVGKSPPQRVGSGCQTVGHTKKQVCSRRPNGPILAQRALCAPPRAGNRARTVRWPWKAATQPCLLPSPAKRPERQNCHLNVRQKRLVFPNLRSDVLCNGPGLHAASRKGGWPGRLQK